MQLSSNPVAVLVRICCTICSNLCLQLGHVCCHHGCPVHALKEVCRLEGQRHQREISHRQAFPHCCCPLPSVWPRLGLWTDRNKQPTRGSLHPSSIHLQHLHGRPGSPDIHTACCSISGGQTRMEEVVVHHNLQEEFVRAKATCLIHRHLLLSWTHGHPGDLRGCPREEHALPRNR